MKIVLIDILRIRLIEISSILLFCAGCGHGDEDRSAYQTDLGKIRNNAKLSLAVDEEGFAAKVRRADERINDAKKSSSYGLVRIELSCQKSETNVAAVALASAIGSASDSRSNLVCTQYGYAYWLKLNWTCPDERTSFYKAKTLKAFGPRATIELLGNSDNLLEVIDLAPDSSGESFNSISDASYNLVKRLKVYASGKIFFVEKRSWAQTIFLPIKLCELGGAS